MTLARPKNCRVCVSGRLGLVIVALMATLALPVLAKKGGSGSSAVGLAADPTATGGSGGGQAALAELQGQMALAQVQVGRVSIAEEPIAASARPTLSDIYDRQESATKEAMSKLRSADGDSAKVTAAATAISAASGELQRYMAANPTISDAVSRRAKIINNELSMIAKSPDSYMTLLKSAGVGEPAYSQARSVVNRAASQAGGKADTDAGGTVTSARSQVRAMLSSRQIKIVDAAMAK